MPSPPTTSLNLCTNCTHFRVAAPISTRVRAPGKNAAEAITKISEEETRVRDAEAKQKIELIKIGQMQWGMRPEMSDHCAEKASANVFAIHELKNRGGTCPSFEPKVPASKRACSSCSLRAPHADPYSSLTAVGTPEMFRAMKDSIDSRIGLEVTSIYNAKGNHAELPIAHDYCQHFSFTEGRPYVALPYPNRHDDCPAYESNVPAAFKSSRSQGRK